VDGKVVKNTEFPVVRGVHRISVDGAEIGEGPRHYLALNKPRGLVTTAKDEQGRDTVYRCFDGAGLGWIAPVGRLDKASEGLLLFTNDPEWAASITDPATGLLAETRRSGWVPWLMTCISTGAVPPARYTAAVCVPAAASGKAICASRIAMPFAVTVAPVALLAW